MIIITGTKKDNRVSFLVYNDNFELQLVKPYTPELDDLSVEGMK